MADFFDDRAPCTFCGQLIQARSVRCVHCLKELSWTTARNLAGIKNKALMLGAGLLAFGAIFLHQSESLKNDLEVSHSEKRAYSLQELDSRLNSQPSDSPAESEESQAEYNDQALNGAISEWTRAILAHPKNADAYLERGWIYNQLQQYDNAIYDLTKSIELNPKVSDAYAKRAWVWDTLGEYRKALRDATLAIKLDPQNVQAYEARACAYGSLGDSVKAARDSAKSDHVELK